MAKSTKSTKKTTVKKAAKTPVVKPSETVSGAFEPTTTLRVGCDPQNRVVKLTKKGSEFTVTKVDANFSHTTTDVAEAYRCFHFMETDASQFATFI